MCRREDVGEITPTRHILREELLWLGTLPCVGSKRTEIHRTGVLFLHPIYFTRHSFSLQSFALVSISISVILTGIFTSFVVVFREDNWEGDVCVGGFVFFLFLYKDIYQSMYSSLARRGSKVYNRLSTNTGHTRKCIELQLPLVLS